MARGFDESGRRDMPTCLWSSAAFLSLLAAFDNVATPQPSPSARRGSPDPAAVATDLYGDPLPPGAVVRLGTTRFRRTNESELSGLAFLADDKTLLTAQGNELQFWNVADGRLVRTLPSPVLIYGF